MNVALSNSRFVRDSEDQLNLFLKCVKVSYLLIHLIRGIASLVLLYKGLNLLKGIASHIAGYKDDLLNLRFLLTLKGKEEILLYKLVIELATLSIVYVGLVDIYTRGIG